MDVINDLMAAGRWTVVLFMLSNADVVESLTLQKLEEINNGDVSLLVHTFNNITDNLRTVVGMTSS